MRSATYRGTSRLDDRALARLARGLLVAVVVVTLAFAAYYYWDRYVALDDQSPVDRNIAHLQAQARSNPQDADTRLALAQYYLENGMVTKALDQAQQVLRAYPDKHEALFLVGVAQAQAGQPQAAIPPLEKLAAFRRESPMAKIDTTLEATLYYIGESHIKLNAPAKAIPVLVEALTIERTDADALYQLGLAYALTGRHQEAVAQLQKAVMFVPDLTEAYHQLAQSYTALAMPDHAAYGRGMEAYSVKNDQTARTELTLAASRLPDFAPAQLGLALTLERLGERQLARLTYEKVLAVEPDNMLAGRGLSRIDSSAAIH